MATTSNAAARPLWPAKLCKLFLRGAYDRIASSADPSNIKKGVIVCATRLSPGLIVQMQVRRTH
ncbi:MAG: hypothetical protein JWM42_2601 [Burkholderia sp.]|nr:hypothetical protein [Burkholderia sp.]